MLNTKTIDFADVYDVTICKEQILFHDEKVVLIQIDNKFFHLVLHPLFGYFTSDEEVEVIKSSDRYQVFPLIGEYNMKFETILVDASDFFDIDKVAEHTLQVIMDTRLKSVYIESGKEGDIYEVVVEEVVGISGIDNFMQELQLLEFFGLSNTISDQLIEDNSPLIFKRIQEFSTEVGDALTGEIVVRKQYDHIPPTGCYFFKRLESTGSYCLMFRWVIPHKKEHTSRINPNLN